MWSPAQLDPGRLGLCGDSGCAAGLGLAPRQVVVFYCILGRILLLETVTR
jgi:hypothetical protein